MTRSALWVSAVVIVGVVAAASTKLDRRIVCSNEVPAIATLRNIGGAQVMFQRDAKCDLDRDGIGEYGTLAELTATEGVRADAIGGKRGAVLDTSILPSHLAAVDGSGIVGKGGYCFRIFLPGAKGGAVHEGKGSPLSGPVDIDATEKRWCAYSWPVAHGNSGTRTFFVNQGGDIWRAEGRYSGVFGGPAWDAAMPADGRPGWSPGPDPVPHIGRDGNEWRPVN